MDHLLHSFFFFFFLLSFGPPTLRCRSLSNLQVVGVISIRGPSCGLWRWGGCPSPLINEVALRSGRLWHSVWGGLGGGLQNVITCQMGLRGHGARNSATITHLFHCYSRKNPGFGDCRWERAEGLSQSSCLWYVLLLLLLKAQWCSSHANEEGSFFFFVCLVFSNFIPL